MEQMSCRRGRCCQKVSEQLGSQGFRQQFRQLFHFDQQFCFVAIFHIEFELPKVLIKVLFCALFLGKELFWVLF